MDPYRRNERGRADAERDDESGATGTDAPDAAGGREDAGSESGDRDRPDDASASAGTGTDAGAEMKALNDRFLRLAAEYDNYRRRTERERGESWTRGQAELVKQLLDPLDDLQRVADYSAENANVEALLEGVQMVERKLLRALESAGLEVLEARDQPFDPEQHEALMTLATENEEEDNSVGEVFQKGYRFKNQLLRPARVQVRKHGG